MELDTALMALTASVAQVCPLDGVALLDAKANTSTFSGVFVSVSVGLVRLDTTATATKDQIAAAIQAVHAFDFSAPGQAARDKQAIGVAAKALSLQQQALINLVLTELASVVPGYKVPPVAAIDAKQAAAVDAVSQ